MAFNTLCTDHSRRAPPTTISMSLLGSWDNFTRSYKMKRDSRVGQDHWSGCHRFSDIICDGNLEVDRKSRDGGLKMGGTYWYFYRLDDDIEFHNSAEPSTTQCPMLPGQLVNVLDMPVVLSGNRSRNPSISSTSSEKRTLVPADKFMNPRAVPAKPQLPRLKTSPPLAGRSWNSNGNTPSSSHADHSASTTKTESQASSSTTLRALRLTRKPSNEIAVQSASPRSATAGGMRSAFRSIRTPRSDSRDHTPVTGLKNQQQHFELDGRPLPEVNDPAWQTCPLGSSREVSPARSRLGRDEHDLAFRRPPVSSNGSSAAVSIASFEQHRRQRSRSRTPSSLRNSMSLEDGITPAPVETGVKRLPLSTLKEVPSTQNTPAAPLTGKGQTHVEDEDVNLEKRLPTLPNTPSSAYPPSSATATYISNSSIDLEALQSHFSCTTIDTSTSGDLSVATESTEETDWSNDYTTDYSMPNSGFTDDSLIESEPMSALVDGDLMTPTHERLSRTRNLEAGLNINTQSQRMPERDMSSATTFSSSMMSSTTASSLASSPSQYANEDDNWHRPIHRATSVERFQHQHYRLPVGDYGSEITLKEPARPSKTDVPPVSQPPAAVVGIRRQDTGDQNQQHQGELAHSTTMQELMNELSYLGGMINQP